MWTWIFLYANIFILSGWTKFYKVIKPRAQVFFSVCQDLQAIQDILFQAVLCRFFFCLKKSEAFSLCGFATPFFFPNSRSPITRSNLEFTASNNCLMDPRVYTAWHWHPDSIMKVPISTTVSCFLLLEKKKGKKREKLQALFLPGAQGSSECFSHQYLLTKFWKRLSICSDWKCQLSDILSALIVSINRS